jgi:pheromone alpha factor receptor
MIATNIRWEYTKTALEISVHIFFDQTSPEFNPQYIALYHPDGSNTTLTLDEFNTANLEALNCCIVFAAQIGACGVLLTLGILLTHTKRRKAVLFVVNMLALATVIIRSTLQIYYSISPHCDTYSYMTGDYSDLPQVLKYVSVAAASTALLLQILIQISLILQVRCVYSDSQNLSLGMTLGAVTLGLTSEAWP